MGKKFTPSICEGENAEYQGTVSFRTLTLDERLDLYDEMSVDEMPDDEKSKGKFYVNILRHISKKSAQFVDEVCIVRKSDSKRYDNWDEIKSDGDLSSIVVEVCKKILGNVMASI